MQQTGLWFFFIRFKKENTMNEMNSCLYSFFLDNAS